MAPFDAGVNVIHQFQGHQAGDDQKNQHQNQAFAKVQADYSCLKSLVVPPKGGKNPPRLDEFSFTNLKISKGISAGLLTAIKRLLREKNNMKKLRLIVLCLL